MHKYEDKKAKGIRIVLLTAVIIAATIHIIYTVMFNQQLHTVYGFDISEEAFVAISGRGDSTSTWVKRDYNLYGETVDLMAQTVDATFHNNSQYNVSSWNLIINITGDCFINNAWCGVWEIHQNVASGHETVQSIDLRNYRLEDITLEYLYDGDLLIPLEKGDFLRYYPSEKDREMPIESESAVTVGAIFYYLNDLDLTDYHIDYYYHRSLFQGIGYFVTAFLFLLWFVLFFIYEVSKYTYKKAWEEMETQGRIDRAEAENRAKSIFLANMSHEIRTPINTVLGLDTMILRESREEHIRTYAKEIKNAGQMLLSLINGILDSSKIEAGKMELVPADYSLKQMVFDVRTITKAIIDAKNLEYIITIAQDLPSRLNGDDVRIKQIIINLLTNAAKYTEKGSVTLSVGGHREDGKLRLSVSVKDTGIGIKEEDLQKLAERFTRLDEQRNRNIEGTGLGMSLVKGLLELMDSKLNIASTYGEGSEFSFEILQDIVNDNPIGEIDYDSMEVDEANGYEVSFMAPDAVILAVDDNPMNLMVFEKLLKETKVKIEKAASGKEALKLTSENTYDIIFMDHMMPEMDGIECFHRIREQEGGLNNQTPVIILTANALQGAKEEYLKEGFTDFLKKPIDPSELEEKVSTFLPKEKISKTFEKNEGKDCNDNAKNLPEIEGVDIAYGISHVGDAESTLRVMKQFTIVAGADVSELEGYFDALKKDNADREALKSYRIKVHSMKTSAGLFGALQVYGVAAFLEMAARDEDVKRIIDVTPYFFDFWNKLTEKVKAYFDSVETENASTDKKLGNDEARDLLHQLVTSMNAYDIKSADSLLEQLAECEFTEAKKPLIEELKLAVSMLDAAKTAELCDKLAE